MRRVRISAPGKIILSGEHAVVYGKPAILAAVNKRLFISINKSTKNEIITSESPSLARYARNFVLEVLSKQKEKLKIEIFSEIPVGCGMGSSAALAVAMTAALFKLFNRPFNKEKINEIAYEIEKKQHGNPSGGDNTISTYGGFLWYRKEAEFLKLFKPLDFSFEKLPQFVLINSGRPLETTGEMVARVRKLYEQKTHQTEEIFNKIEKTTKQLLVAFQQGKRDLASRMIKENECLLESLGIVNEFAQKVIREIESAGGVAKVCGAGGAKEGSGIILGLHSTKNSLLKIAKERNLPAFEVKLGEEGVRIEEN